MISAFDSTLPQLSADGLLVVLVAVNAYVGWHTGTVRRLVSTAGLYIAFIAAYYSGNSFASLFRKGDLMANAWGFVAVLVAVVLVFEFVGFSFRDRLAHVAVLAFDRIGGVAFGVLLGFFEAVVLFMVALAVGSAVPNRGTVVPADHAAAASAVQAATLASQAARAEPALRAAFAPLIGTDLAGHLDSGTEGITSNP